MSFAPPSMNLRTVVGRPLTWAEEDFNFSSIESFLATVGQLFNNDGSIDPNLLQNTINQYLATAFISQNQSFLAPVGKPIWMPKAMDPSVSLPDNGTAYLRADGTKYLQADYPKLFAYCGHDFDSDPVITGIAVTAGTNTHLSTVAVHAGGGGSAYAANDILTIAGGTGTAATVKVNTVSAGVITAISVLTCGDYTVFPTATSNAATGGSGTGASLDLTSFTGGGGTGYAVNDVLTVVGGVGTPAKVKVTSLNHTSVATVSTVNLGAYTTGPSTPNSPTGGTGTGCSLDFTFSSSVNPATEFRVPVLDGLVLFGADGETPLGTTGGEKTHLLTAAESGVPDHTHAAFGQTTTGALTGAANPIKDASGQTSGVTGGAKSASAAHQNMPPFRAGIFYLVAGYRVNKAWA